jgi:4a-hydroxytetrahydrobiopterin dehydratase
MSEEGWREFLAAGLDDWGVTHSGAMAAYVADSLPAAARLAAAVADVPGLDGVGALLTVGDRRLTVRLTRGVFAGESHHVGLARAISEVARNHGATSDRASIQSVQVSVAARPDEIDVDFWRAVLGYVPLAEDNGIDPLGHGSTIWLQDLDPAKPLRHAMHLDVSVPRDQVEARLAAALAAGGRIARVEDLEATWILADRAGNKVCLAAWPDSGDF